MTAHAPFVDLPTLVYLSRGPTTYTFIRLSSTHPSTCPLFPPAVWLVDIN